MNPTLDSSEARTAPAPELMTGESAGISFGDILRALAKNKWLIAFCALGCLAIAAVFAYTRTPVYESTGTLRLDPTRAGSLGFNDSLALTPGGDALATEMAILQSDQVAIAALNSLTPQQFREFSGLNEDRINYDPAAERLSRADEELLGDFKGGLLVKQMEGTQLIEISYRSSDPEMAALLVNKLVDAYVRVNFDSRYNSVKQVRTWLSAQMDDLRQRAAAAQQKLADFQQRNNLLGTDATNNTTMDGHSYDLAVRSAFVGAAGG